MKTDADSAVKVLKECDWRRYKVKDLFDVRYGINMELNACVIAPKGSPDAVNFVSRTEENNGICAKVYLVDGKTPQPAGLITCAGGGSVLSAFLQEEPFYSGRDLFVLEPRYKMSREAKLFCIAVLKANRYRYAYGRQANKTLPDIELSLPAGDDGLPDMAVMDAYMKSLHSEPISTLNRPGSVPIDPGGWERFVLNDLFEIRKGKRLTSEDQTEGATPYIGAIGSNNGVAGHIGQKAIHEGNTISLSYNGSVGEAFYQSEPFWATDDVNVLYFRKSNGAEFNAYIGLFVCAVLRQEKYKFSYGRKWTLENMRSTAIRLPAKDGRPDWGFMENYIRSLPYGDRISPR